ncbi:MAG: UDP-glucose 4-epimerase GalE [Myxococcota bacterium]
MAILVTGGAGFIGSHTCVELLQAGHRVVVVDNLCNSSRESLRRVERITGVVPELHRVDLLDAPALAQVFARSRPQAVIHFAGLKSVGESVAQPLRYFQNNVTGTLNLLQCMKDHGVHQLVFSSSATVYGDPARVPVTEDMPLSVTNPYGRTKLMVEDICRDLARAESTWRIILLRYFNPVGAHPSGLMGEDPRGIPNNLMPYIMQVAVGRRPHLTVHGKDFPTPDGTGVRDYVHVVDLAQGHVAALAALPRISGCVAVNLGTGRGYSVLEVLQAAGRAVGRELPCVVGPRRPGDVAAVYADASLAQGLLGWQARRGLDEMCADAWRWQHGNPEGYPPETGPAGG